MGTWDDGLYDNDDALDVLGNLLKDTKPGPTATDFVVALGIHSWLNAPLDAEAYATALDTHAAELTQLPADARAVLEAFRADPASFADAAGARSELLQQIMGTYCSGPRHEALLRVPGAAPILEALAARCRAVLDDATAGDLQDLAGPFAALGVLLELDTAGVKRPPRDQVERWRATFDNADAATKDEREFWDVYVKRVRPCFALLA